MTGLAPLLPLTLSPQGGYENIQTRRILIRQNLKNLLRTVPGERIMIPDFGVGLRSFLFEPDLPSTYGEIVSRIKRQIGQYMPFLNVTDIVITSSADDPGLQGTAWARIRVDFEVIPMGFFDSLEILESA